MIGIYRLYEYDTTLSQKLNPPITHANGAMHNPTPHAPAE